MKDLGTCLMHSYIMYKAFMNQVSWEIFLNYTQIILNTNLIPLNLLLSTFNGIC